MSENVTEFFLVSNHFGQFFLVRSVALDDKFLEGAFQKFKNPNSKIWLGSQIDIDCIVELFVYETDLCL